MSWADVDRPYSPLDFVCRTCRAERDQRCMVVGRRESYEATDFLETPHKSRCNDFTRALEDYDRRAKRKGETHA